MEEHMEQEDRRFTPYCNTPLQPTQWDPKTFIALITLFVVIVGGLLGTWSSFTTQMTTLQVTQQLKFEQMSEKVTKLQQQVEQLTSQLSTMDNSLTQLYSKRGN